MPLGAGRQDGVASPWPIGSPQKQRAFPLFAKYNRLQQRSEGLAGAMQTRLDRSRVDAQMLGSLFRVEFLDVAQDENLSVKLGKPVDAGPDVGACLGLGEPRQGLILPGPEPATVAPGFVEGREQVADPDLPAP